MSLSALAVGAHDDVQLSLESYKKILLMEEASAKYAESIKEIPIDIKAKGFATLLMNKSGRLMFINASSNEVIPIAEVDSRLKEVSPKYVIMATGISVPIDSMDKLVDKVYSYYMEHASSTTPIYFFRQIKKNTQSQISNKKLLIGKHTKYDQLHTSMIPKPAAPPKIPEIVAPFNQHDTKKYPASKDDSVYNDVDINASFPGGDEPCMKWIEDNIRYPKNCIAEGVHGRVIVSFVVAKNGEISKIKVVRSPDDRLSKEAIRLVKSMPKWYPAILEGKRVNSLYNMPVMFRLG